MWIRCWGDCLQLLGFRIFSFISDFFRSNSFIYGYFFLIICSRFFGGECCARFSSLLHHLHICPDILLLCSAPIPNQSCSTFCNLTAWHLNWMVLFLNVCIVKYLVFQQVQYVCSTYLFLLLHMVLPISFILPWLSVNWTSQR